MPTHHATSCYRGAPLQMEHAICLTLPCLGPRMQTQTSASTSSSCSLLLRTKSVTKAALWVSSFMASSGLTPSSSIPGYTFKHLQHLLVEQSYRSSHWGQLASDQVYTHCSPKAKPFPHHKKCTPRNGAGTLHDPLHYKTSHASKAAEDPILLIS